MTNEKRLEEVQSILESLNEFENKLHEIIIQGKDIASQMKNYGYNIENEGELLDLYLLSRIKSFLECNEQFRFDFARETLEYEIEEIEAGVYDEED